MKKRYRLCLGVLAEETNKRWEEQQHAEMTACNLHYANGDTALQVMYSGFVAPFTCGMTGIENARKTVLNNCLKCKSGFRHIGIADTSTCAIVNEKEN